MNTSAVATGVEHVEISFEGGKNGELKDKVQQPSELQLAVLSVPSPSRGVRVRQPRATAGQVWGVAHVRYHPLVAQKQFDGEANISGSSPSPRVSLTVYRHPSTCAGPCTMGDACDSQSTAMRFSPEWNLPFQRDWKRRRNKNLRTGYYFSRENFPAAHMR